jgi:bifunctional non-homologous end joining protein LigD
LGRWLYVGRRDGDRIIYAGKIQVGLPLNQATELRSTLQQFIQGKPPLSHSLRRPKAVWLLPQLQAEVAYSNVTADGMLRHGILKGLRYDLEG